MNRLGTLSAAAVLGAGVALVASPQLGFGQGAPGAPGEAPPGVLPGVKMGGSPNLHLVGHLPLGGYFRVMDDEIEQDADRPYAYVSQARDRPGFTIIDLRDLNNVKVLYHWSIENPELHQGLGGMDGKYFKMNGPCSGSAKGQKNASMSCAHYYYVQSLQFAQGTPDADLGAVVADVTGLPDTNKVRIVARLRDPAEPGGFHNTFIYRHSDGHTYLVTTVNGPHTNVFDLGKVVSDPDSSHWKIGEFPVPETQTNSRFGRFGYHDFYLGYDPATHQDKFYGAGRGGYYVYDISDIKQPKLITSITGSAGIEFGHTFTPDPTGRFVIAETEYQYAPIRIFDIQPGLTGKVQTVNRPIGAWSPDWQDLVHNHEVRWPFVFSSAYEDGLQVFSMYDPTHPVTVGWYYTCQCTHEHGFGGPPLWEGTSVMQGAFGIDIRNRDGLIMISDSNTGVWFFRMDGFNGWNGHDWGVPNVSSVQDYDHGPEGATAPTGRPAASP
jgi:hypothetical protein